MFGCIEVIRIYNFYSWPLDGAVGHCSVTFSLTPWLTAITLTCTYMCLCDLSMTLHRHAHICDMCLYDSAAADHSINKEQ